jgi:hypothetical protein
VEAEGALVRLAVKSSGIRVRAHSSRRQAGLAVCTIMVELETRLCAISATLGRRPLSAVPKPDLPESLSGAYDHAAVINNDDRRSETGCKVLLLLQRTYRAYFRLHRRDDSFATLAKVTEQSQKAAMKLPAVGPIRPLHFAANFL